MFAQESALKFFCREFWMWILFLTLENHHHDYRAACLLLYLFVVMMEVVGRMQASGGVGAGNVLSFPLAFVKSKASHVACFCFSALYGLCAAEAASSLPDESWACIFPQWPQGRAGAGPPVHRDHRVLPWRQRETKWMCHDCDHVARRVNWWHQTTGSLHQLTDHICI